MKWYVKDGEYRQAEDSPGDGWEEAKAADAIMSRIDALKDTHGAEREDLERQIKELKAEIRQQIEEFEARVNHVSPTDPDSGPEPVSLAKCIRGFFKNDWSGAEYERDLVAGEFKERATLSTTSDTYGGFIVPSEYLANEFVELLYNSVAALRAGVREVPVSGGPIIVPTHQTGATTYWIADNATITASDQKFGQKTAQPHGLAALCRISNQLLGMSNPGVESIVRGDIATALGVELDNQIWNGTGSDGKPTGILNTDGILDLASSAAITADGIWDMMKKIEAAKVNVEAGLSMASSVKQWYELLQAADGSGTPKYSNDAAPMIQKSFGSGSVPIYTTHNLADATTILGVFREVLLFRWGGIQFAASQEASDGTNHAFIMNQTWIRAIMSVDVIVRQPAALCFNDNWT